MKLLLVAASAASAAAAAAAAPAGSVQERAFQASTSPLSVDVGPNVSTYTLAVNGQEWLSSGPTRLHGVQLLASGPTVHSSGNDVLGAYSDTRQDYACTAAIKHGKGEDREEDGDPTPCFSTIVRDYTASGTPLVVFLQNHTLARTGTESDPSIAVAKEQVLSAFPSFQVGPTTQSNISAAPTLGYTTYFDQMVGGMDEGTRYGKWTADAALVGGSMGGPTILFDAAQSNAMVLSSFQNFLAGSSVQRTATTSNGDISASFLEFGLLGSISSIPEGFLFATAAYVGSGVNDAVRGFGDCLLRLYGKTSRAASITPWDGRNGDVSISKLGYSTDNGAYMYYNTGPTATTEEEALKQVHDNANASGIPFSYILLDSWWYYKGVGNGVKNWTATPDTFPNGLANFNNYTRWPVVGHNRYWSVDTDYAKQNGGLYDFILEPENGKGIPTDLSFWDFLMESSKEWGLSVYEQDWLHNEWEGLNATLQSATLSRDWLLQMGDAAEKHGIFIQYCMAYSRFALASVEVPAVDQIRVSDDYYVDLAHLRTFSVNAYIGTSSMLAAALGLAPSKDVFWSTSDQPGHPKKYVPHDPLHHPRIREDHPALEAALATLSAGPVSPGDGVGMTDHDLILCSCAEDGTLLKPSWPLTPIDSYFSARAGMQAVGPKGELYATYTTLPGQDKAGSDAYSVGHILAMDLQNSYTLSLPTELPSPARPSNSAETSYFTWATNTSACGSAAAPTVTRGAISLEVSACGKSDFQVLHAAPEVICATHEGAATQWGLLGEAGKWVPVSPQRFRDVGCISGTAGFAVTVVGTPEEKVTVRFAKATSSKVVGTAALVVEVECVIGESGTAIARADTQECK